MSTNTKKLAVLRSRTDHDLLILVRRELDRGFTLVDVAASRNSPMYAKALKAYETAESLLPRITELSHEDRARLHSQLKELRQRIDMVPAYANVRTYMTSFAS
jgi:hypothetical protein